jgi:hypothetical protein
MGINLTSTSDKDQIARNAAECGEGDIFGEDAAFFGAFHINGIEEIGWLEINHDGELHTGILNSHWFKPFSSIEAAKNFVKTNIDEEMELAKFFKAIAMFKGV